MPTTITDSHNNGRPGRPRSIRATAEREYVSGGERLIWTPNALQTLPLYVDDVTRDFGDDLYLRMMFDSQVAACVHVLKVGILAQKPTVTPARKEGEEQFEQAKEIAEFCERNLMRLRNLRTHTLYNLLDAMPLGHRIAEIVYEIADQGQDSGKLVLGAVRVKPRRMTGIVVDAYMRIVGVLATVPGKADLTRTGSLFVPGRSNLSNLLPRKKFVIVSFRPNDEDPRGTSMLRPAYTPWNLKTQLWLDALKYWTQFGGASVWGSTGEGAQAVPVYDDDGNAVLNPDGSQQTIPPVTALLNVLKDWKNGSAVAVPFGTEINPVPPQGQGQVWDNAIQLLDRQITKAILLQELATLEGRHQSRAASETHAEALAWLIGWGRTLAEEAIENDLFAPLVEMNFGLEALPLLPDVSFGDVQDPDFEKMWNAAAFLLQAGFIARSQLQAIDELLGLPPRTAEEVEEWAPVNSPGEEDVEQKRSDEERGKQRVARRRGGGSTASGE